VETVAALRRITGDATIAHQATTMLLRMPNARILPLLADDIPLYVSVVMETALRGMDSIVASCARRSGATLVTWDEEMIERARKAVETKRPSEIVLAQA